MHIPFQTISIGVVYLNASSMRQKACEDMQEGNVIVVAWREHTYAGKSNTFATHARSTRTLFDAPAFFATTTKL